MNDSVQVLREVELLRDVDDATIDEVAMRAQSRSYPVGSRLVTELEPGADLFIIMSGEAEVSVEDQEGGREVIRTLSRAAVFGEMAGLTGELRSATVIAKTDVAALVITDTEFAKLRARRPQIAVALVRVLAKRIADADAIVQTLLEAGARAPGPKLVVRRGSVRRVWQELVVNHHRDLAFLSLASFVLTLIAIRAIVHVSFRLDFAPRDVLRTAYMTGFGLVLFSSAIAVLTFRPGWRRFIAVAYGIGGALILNELGVTLAFDIFYKDIHTPDPNVPFDVERLYARAEPLRAIIIGVVVLVQAVYLRKFYTRALFVLRTRLRRH
jgi:CRP-like cAMP-binding protein